MNFDDFNTNINISELDNETTPTNQKKFTIGGTSTDSIAPKSIYHSEDIFREIDKKSPSLPKKINNLMEDVREQTGFDRLVKINDKFFMVSRLDETLDLDYMNYPKYIYNVDDLTFVDYSLFTVNGIDKEEFFDGAYMDTHLDELKNLFKERVFYSISDTYEIIQDYETMEEL